MKVTDVEFLGSFMDPRRFRCEPLPHVAFVGRSNVGKSSLINTLVQRKGVARISRTPGKTRAVNCYHIETSDSEIRRFYAVDLPGYGYAKVAKTVRDQWGPMIERYLGSHIEMRTIVFLVDARGPTELDALTVEWLEALGYHPIIVPTKIDKFSYGQRSQRLHAVRAVLGLPPTTLLYPFSSRTGEGRQELWQAIRAAIRMANSLSPPPYASRETEQLG